MLTKCAKKSVFITLFLLACVFAHERAFSADLEDRLLNTRKALFERLESQEISLHGKVGAFRRLRNVNNERMAEAKEYIKKALYDSLPWKEDDLSVMDIEYLRNQGFMNTEARGKQKATTIATSAKAMEWLFARWLKALELAETADEQLKGLKHIYLLYKSFGKEVKLQDGGPFPFKGNLVNLSSELENVPSAAKDAKILVLGEVKSGPDSMSMRVETGCMLRILSPEAIPESEDEVDVVICLESLSSSTTSTSSSTGGSGRVTVTATITTTTDYERAFNVRAYDYRSGRLLKEAKNMWVVRVITAPSPFYPPNPRLVEERGMLDRIKKFIAEL